MSFSIMDSCWRKTEKKQVLLRIFVDSLNPGQVGNDTLLPLAMLSAEVKSLPGRYSRHLKFGKTDEWLGLA